MPRVGIRDLPKGTIKPFAQKKLFGCFYWMFIFFVQSAIIYMKRTGQWVTSQEIWKQEAYSIKSQIPALDDMECRHTCLRTQ